MALAQVNTATVTSSTSSIKLTGIDDNSVYVLVVANAQPTANADGMALRVLVSGTEDTSSNYDSAGKTLIASASPSEVYLTNQNKFSYNAVGNSANSRGNGIYYLYNFYASSEYSYMTAELISEYANTTQHRGMQGGGVHTVQQSCNGVEFLYPAGNIAQATVTLYRVV